MKIGVIGLGMVGKAIYDVLIENHEMSFYDIKFSTSKITDVLRTDIIYIAVPTLPDENNKCNISILSSVIEDLINLEYNGVICIKSTITPGTTIEYINKYKNDRICYCPEFLKERSAYDDFKFHNEICIIGTINDTVFEIVKESHKNISQIFKKVHPTEAELTKYFQNVYNTCRILFANAFYEVCTKNNIEYNSIIESLLARHEIDDNYIRCSKDLRGPSGPCLVKDTLAFNEYVKSLQLEIKPNMFQTLVDDMKLYPRTVIVGTRSEVEYFGRELNK